jgi:hypothetical protein
VLSLALKAISIKLSTNSVKLQDMQLRLRYTQVVVDSVNLKKIISKEEFM